SPCVVMKS
ncbi:DNA polymerase B family protein, partial [Vibrio parahaemolyticus V-223/04]